MREIKFRVWWENQMRHNAICGNGQVLFIPNATGEYIWINQAECKSMQFTGLKDKNGIEIYEGDFISESGSSAYEVIWQSHSVQWIMQSVKEGRNYRHMAYDYAQMNYEVIGNIYENSGLLVKTMPL